ncbi:polyprenyl synthetase family protein [Streptomyces sp. NPDC048623]|uniref:polyprenyl synthetase family protein n=1 Tax=Streptomyces sp. NPDC048623 TaxID=3155761 RepID=UPI003446F9C3
MSSPATSDGLDLEGAGRAVDAVLEDFLAGQVRGAAERGLPVEGIESLRAFLAAGGKRLRPGLCVVGWHAAGKKAVPASVVRVAASLEMFHSFALIHDDVMDASETRRGRSTVHRAAAMLHQDGRDQAAADRLGSGLAILVGNLAHAWAMELVHTAGLRPHQLAEVLPLTDVMRTEIMHGQYLDMIAAGRPTEDAERALRIACYKTARYSIEWPLRIGAALAGAEPGLHDTLAEFARPVGEAYQLRDDLLGVFGTPARTGKSDLDDLRDGKHTVLVSIALQRAGQAQQRLLHDLLGTPDLDESSAAWIRDVLVSTGARDTVEELITARLEQALHVVDRSALPPAAAAALRDVAHAATARTT